MADKARIFGRFSGILRTLVLFIHFGEKNANCHNRLGRSADVHGISDLGRMSNALSAVRRTSFGSVALCGYIIDWREDWHGLSVTRLLAGNKQMANCSSLLVTMSHYH